MTALTEFCTPKLEIEFESGTWTDVTSYLQAANTHAGRSNELARFDAGTASFTLKNSDRRFDPLYSSGPYYGDILPGKRIRFTATWSATSYPIWQGFINSWRQQYAQPRAAAVVLDCTDGFQLLAAARMPRNVYATIIEAGTPRAWWRLQETSGTIATDSSGNGHHGSYTPGTTDRAVPALVVGDVDATAINFDGITNAVRLPRRSNPDAFPFSIEFWFNTHTSTVGGPGFYFLFESETARLHVRLHQSGVRALLTDSTNEISATTDQNVRDGRTHHCVITFTSGSVAPTIWLDGLPAVCTDAAASGTVAIPVGPAFIGVDKYGAGSNFPGTLSEFAIYDDAFNDLSALVHFVAGTAPYDNETTGSRIGTILDLIGWPAGDRDLDTGRTRLGPAVYDTENALAYLQDVEATEQGRLYMSCDGKVTFRDRHAGLTRTEMTTSQATFGDTGSDLKYVNVEFAFDDSMVYNEVSATTIGGTQQIVSDATSQTTYGTRRFDMGQLLWRTPREAEHAAEWLLAHYKDAATRVTAIEVNPRRSPSTLWPQVLGREHCDRITVKRSPQSVGSTISQQLWIESIDHTVDLQARSWVTRYGLGPAETGSYGIWGTSLWGSTFVWAA